MSNRMNFRRRHENRLMYFIRTNDDLLYVIAFAFVMAWFLVQGI